MTRQPLKDLLTKAETKEMVKIIQDSRALLRAALVAVIEDPDHNLISTAQFMTGVAAGIMVTLAYKRSK
jgi:hypothetical protein